MNRKQLESLVWKHTHPDYRGVANGALARSAPVPVRTVLHYLPEHGTCVVALQDLTLGELLDHLPSKERKRLGYQLWRVVLAGLENRVLGVYGPEEQQKCEAMARRALVPARALLWAGPRPVVGSFLDFEAQSLAPLEVP